MACAYDPNKLMDYMDGGLDQSERDRVAVHLRGCLTCARYIERQKTIRDLMRSLPTRRCPVDLSVKIHESISQEDTVNIPDNPFLSALWRIGAVAAILALFLWGSLGIKQSDYIPEMPAVVEAGGPNHTTKTMKATSGMTDILDPKYTSEVYVHVKDIRITAGQKYNRSEAVVVKLDGQSKIGDLRGVLTKNNMTCSKYDEYAPVYHLEDVTPRQFREFLAALKATFTDVSVGDDLLGYSSTQDSELRTILFIVEIGAE